MVALTGKLSFLLLLTATSTEGARVANHESTEWGRSCASLETRFHNQQTRLAESESTTALVRSISLMRTLRRANARDCEWATSGEVDTSVAAEMAARQFRQTPCYEPARDALNAAQSLPEEEREHAMEVAVTILLSDEEGCAPLEVEAPDLNDSDDDLEGELDDDTDEMMEALASSPSASLMQQEQPILSAIYGGWASAFLGGWQLVIACIVIGLLMGLICRTAVHMIIRIFRWIRCKVFGNSCAEYSPAGWVRVLVGGGCGLTGMLLGPFGTVLGATHVGGAAGEAVTHSFAFGYAQLTR